MEYVSTRGSAPTLDFEGVTLAGLASDGGLFVPREWPRFSADQIGALAGLPYAELAVKVMLPFVGDSLTLHARFPDGKRCLPALPFRPRRAPSPASKVV